MKDVNEFFGLENIGESKDDAILEAIILKVEHYLEISPELLMSYLYRLDIAEEKINAIFNQPKELPIHEALGLLIWERQKQRIATKKRFKQDPIEGWEF